MHLGHACPHAPLQSHTAEPLCWSTAVQQLGRHSASLGTCTATRMASVLQEGTGQHQSQIKLGTSRARPREAKHSSQASHGIVTESMEPCVQTTVTVVDATECGNVGFSKAVYTVAHPQPSAELSIVRKHGSSGPLQVGYCTQDRDALAGAHLKSASSAES